MVDYYSEFPIMKKADGLSPDDLIRAAQDCTCRIFDFQTK